MSTKVFFYTLRPFDEQAIVKDLAQQYGADYVSIPYTSIANDGHPTVCGHKYIARQILKAVRK